MFALMKRLSSTVRRLAERHARLQGQVLKLEAEAAAVGAKLSKAKAQLDAISLVLPTFDGRVQPDQIGAIAGWDHCYGKRGAFQAQVLAVLALAGAEWTTTRQLADRVCEHFGLVFLQWEQKRDWFANTFRTRLKKLQAKGLIERRRAGPGHSDAACWRLAQAVELSLDDLRAHADAAGLAVAT